MTTTDNNTICPRPRRGTPKGLPSRLLCEVTPSGTGLLNSQMITLRENQAEPIAQIPLSDRQWMIRAFDWNPRNEKLRKSILATM